MTADLSIGAGMGEPVPGAPLGRDPVGAAGLETSDQIKGSTLLMLGRVIGVLANMVVQVVVVRYLSKGDYGAFAYALSFVTTIRIFVTLGHARTITRFFAIYEERREYDKLFGTILMELGIVATMGLASVAGAWALQGWIAGTLVGDPLVANVLLLIIVLAPIEALDELLEGLFAVFARPKSVFMRRYVLTPALKLSVVAVLVTTGQGVTFLAAGYVVVSAAGLAFYVPVLLRTMRERGLLEHFHWRSARMPVREVFSFSIPLLSNELFLISMSTVPVMVLGFYRGAAAVAALRAIRPVATLNSFVVRSFHLLFLPLASRLYARADEEGLRAAYWRTAVWIAVLTFPMLAMTLVFAEPVTVTLFGERYRDSAPYLALLAVGYYCNAALGFNSVVLQVVGRLRYLVLVNTGSALVAILLCLVLAPTYGALGVAVAESGVLVLQNLLNQLGLRRIGVGVFSRAHARVYGSILLVTGALWVLERTLDPGLPGSLVLAGTGAAVVFRLNRELMGIADIYPRLAAVPLLRHLAGPRPADTGAGGATGHTDEADTGDDPGVPGSTSPREGP